ncbi:MAG: hypothetical protein SVR94_07070 [Pseudomonadota bacterium]|nr:hypothetical protein [Pseudomonadota bacterium]
MGAKTNPILAIFTTLLNMRLNIWMANPRRSRPPRFIFWLRYYLKELTRQGSEADALVNLSDGAHHENLGIYPLLRRRCRIIIASDAGSDPQFQMEDLANLQRKARIDLGIEIKFKDINKIFPDVNQKEHYSQASFMIGDIHYPDQDAVGKLIYMKTALIGREPEDLLAYRRKNPDFPDQTTADQFFDEEQFESYRKLGQIIAEATFAQEQEFDTFEKFKSFFLVS